MDEPLHAHLRQPILKILHSHGITRASSVSLQVLSSLLDKYMKGVVLSCQEYANHAGRNGLRVQDMMQSLEEMGCRLEDLEDYLEVEGGVRKEKEKSGYDDVLGMQRYANVVGPRKEAELIEFKESLRLGLVAPEDRYSERLRYTRLPTPDLTEQDPSNPYPDMGYPSSGDEDEQTSEHPLVQLPLSPISNSPPHARSAAMETENTSSRLDNDSIIPPFLPPLPQILPETAVGDSVPDTEKEEEKKREAELLKEKETIEQQAKNKDEGEDAPAVQSFPANYIVPAPYDVSKLQARGTWHLPSISMTALNGDDNSAFGSFSSSSPLKASNPGLPSGLPTKPYVRGDSTTEELLTALHALTPGSQTDPNNPVTPSSVVASTVAANTISTNPLRHKVSLVFLGTTPSRYNTPDTLFGFTPSYSVTPRPAGPLPTYVNVLEVQPGRGDKSGVKSKGKDTGDLPVPPSQGRNVGVPASVVGAVTGTTSRIPAIGKRVLAKPTLARTKRLAPPPPQKRDDNLLLYHTPKPPLLAHWNMAVSGSNSQYSGALDHAKAAAELAKVSKEKNPYGVAEATLAYTWDWNVKRPWEGLEWVRGGSAFAPPPPPPPSLSVASTSTPGGIGMPGPAARTVPKISVNFPGRRSITLPSVTPTTAAAGVSGLIARLPGLAERSPSHLSSTSVALPGHADTTLEGSMAPPPLPRTSVPPLEQSLTQTVELTSASGDTTLKEEDEKEDVMMMMDSVLGPDVVQTPVDDMELDSAISQLAGDGPPISRPSASDVALDVGLNRIGNETRDAFDPAPFTAMDSELEGDIDKEIADVLGDTDGDAGDVDVDADIAEALGSVDHVVSSRPAVVSPPSNSYEEPQLDMELAELLEGSPPIPHQPAVEAFRTLDPIMSPRIGDKASTTFETLGVGDPPAPPGDSGAVLLSAMDFLPASSGGTLAFASGITLPLATSALRSTTTPQGHIPGYSSSVPQGWPASIAVEDMKHEDVAPALGGLSQQPGSTEPS